MPVQDEQQASEGERQRLQERQDQLDDLAEQLMNLGKALDTRGELLDKKDQLLEAQSAPKDDNSRLIFLENKRALTEDKRALTEDKKALAAAWNALTEDKKTLTAAWETFTSLAEAEAEAEARGEARQGKQYISLAWIGFIWLHMPAGSFSLGLVIDGHSTVEHANTSPTFTVASAIHSSVEASGRSASTSPETGALNWDPAQMEALVHFEECKTMHATIQINGY
jgi:hypothetical protein